MSRLVAPTKESEVAIEKLGLSITDTEGSMRPFNEVLVEIREKMGGLDEAQQGLIAKQLAGQEAMTGLLSIVNASEEDFNSLTEAVDNSAGASKRMAKTMMDNLNGSFTILKSTVEGIAISFGEILAPTIKSSLEKVQGLAEWVLNLNDRQKKLLITIPTLVAGIGTITLVGGKAITTINMIGKALTSAKILMAATNTATTTLTTSQNLLNTAIMGLKSPLGIAVTILGALTLAFKDVDGIGQVLKATLTGLVAGFVAFKTVAGIQALITGVTTALAGQTIAMNIATVSTTALNTALAANPIGLVVAGIAALTAGLFVLVKSFTKASKEAEAYNKETEKIVNNTEKINDSVKENAKAYEDNTKAIKSQTQANKMLAKEIQNLVDIEELDAGQKLLLHKKIDELNSSVEGLALSYDEETGKLNMNSEAIEKQLKVQEAQIELSSDLEEQARIREDLALTTQSQEEAMARLAEVTLKLNEAENLSYGDKKLLEQQQEELTLSIEQTKTNIDSLNTSYDDLSSRIETNATIIEEANKLKVESEEEYQDALSQTAYVADMVATLDEEAKERAQKILEEFTAHATNAFSKINENATMSMDELIGNLEYNQTLLEEWTTNLAIMMDRGYDKAFVENLREMGPEMAATVETMANATEEEIEKFNTKLADGAEIASSSFITTMTSEGVISVGSDMLNAVADGITENESLNIASENSIKDAKDSMDKQVEASKFSTVGENISDGIVDGINKSEKKVENAVRNVAKNVKNTFQSELDIHSPSRVFKTLAGFINEGIAEGLEDSAGLPTKAMEKICDEIINSGDEISTGLISIDKDTGEAIYDNTYKSVMDKIELFEKERDKRIEVLEKTNTLTEEYLEKEIEGAEKVHDAKIKLMEQEYLAKVSLIDEESAKLEKTNTLTEEYLEKEIEGAEKVHDAKIKLMEQEYLAKVSLIDEESAKQIQALNDEIEAINRKKEEEKKSEEERKYQEEYEEKVGLLNQAWGNYEEYKKREKELDELVSKRKKELLEQEREEEKKALKEKIELIKAQASQSKEILKEEFSDAKFQENLNQDKELDRLNSMQEKINKQLEEENLKLEVEKLKFKEEKLKLEEEKLKIAKITNDAIRKNKEKELQKREKELQEREKEFQLEEERKKLEEEKIKISQNTNATITQNEAKELTKRQEALEETVENSTNILKNFSVSVSTISQQCGRALLKGFKSTENEISSYISGLGQMLRDTVTNISFDAGTVDGSHRTGLRSVPFDNYSAILHRGEMVLTQPEAERYRQGQEVSRTSNAEINMNFYNVKEERTAFKVNRETKQLLRTLGLA